VGKANEVARLTPAPAQNARRRHTATIDPLQLSPRPSRKATTRSPRDTNDCPTGQFIDFAPPSECQKPRQCWDINPPSRQMLALGVCLVPDFCAFPHLVKSSPSSELYAALATYARTTLRADRLDWAVPPLAWFALPKSWPTLDRQLHPLEKGRQPRPRMGSSSINRRAMIASR
jgi:hypothetical protein